MNVTEFNFDNLPIRVIQGKTERRMPAVDVCKALGYKNPSDAWKDLKRRNEELKGISVTCKLHASDGKQYGTDVINLKGVMKVCMLAKTDKAVQFREWASDVLVEKITSNITDENYLDHIEKLLTIAKQEKAKRIEAENNLNEIKPDHDLWLSDKGAYDIGSIAKKISNGKIGSKKLFEILRKTTSTKIWFCRRSCYNKIKKP